MGAFGYSLSATKMGNSRSSQALQEENISQIEADTGFTANQIERLWSRFTSLDKQQKGYLTREDFLRIPELAINPLGDRIVHAFFRDGRSSDVTHDYSPEKGAGADRDVVNFCDFVRVLAHFRPLKKNMEKNKLNSRQEKLKCMPCVIIHLCSYVENDFNSCFFF